MNNNRKQERNEAKTRTRTLQVMFRAFGRSSLAVRPLASRVLAAQGTTALESRECCAKSAATAHDARFRPQKGGSRAPSALENPPLLSCCCPAALCDWARSLLALIALDRPPGCLRPAPPRLWGHCLRASPLNNGGYPGLADPLTRR